MNNIMVAPHHVSSAEPTIRRPMALGNLWTTLSSPLRGSLSPLQGSLKTSERSRVSADPQWPNLPFFNDIGGKARSSLAVLRSTGKGRYEEVVEVVVVEAVVVPVHMALDQVMVQEVALEMVSTMVVAEVVEEEAMVVEEGQATVALARDIDPEVDMDMAVVGKEEVVEEGQAVVEVEARA
ncbi:hypothetical protein CDL15_Pgr012447 [Punica granatum]|uniref:Uncharacterized protein n=1 Tax=Punica granatum TaxID=22663 RepID=A0A218WXZ4_PUNGR|nr:hypothetical protein CDL15_Pgr012447 [Punica granatum]